MHAALYAQLSVPALASKTDTLHLRCHNLHAPPLPLSSVPPKPLAAPLSLQTFTTQEAVNWPNSSGLTQLLTVATVCNKAKYDDTATDAGARGLLGGGPKQQTCCRSVLRHGAPAAAAAHCVLLSE